MGIQSINNVIGQNTIQQKNTKIVKDYEVSSQEKNDIAINAVKKKTDEEVREELSNIPAIQEKKVIKAIEEANKKIQDNNKEFEFSVHKGTKQIMIKVIDKGSGKIIKEFPPEKILDMVASMCEAAGLFVDEKR